MSNDTAAARAAELHKDLEAKLLALVDGDGWKAFLRTASRFTNYSASNVMLILSQCPEATRVAGFRAWQGHSRFVMRGQKAIKILAPCRFKVTDDKTGQDRWAVRGFTVVNVFDVSQTDGEPLPEVAPRLLTGHGFTDLYDGLAALVAAAGFSLERGDCGQANGYTDHGKKVVRVRDDVDQVQAVKTLAHELVHVLLHAPDQITYRANRALCETEAESVAYVVCANAGLDSEGYTIPYLALWAGGDPAIVKATAERVVKTAQQIIAGLSAPAEVSKPEQVAESLAA